MPYSYLSHLRCSKTGETHDADQPQQLSRAGAPLLASYDLEALKKAYPALPVDDGLAIGAKVNTGEMKW